MATYKLDQSEKFEAMSMGMKPAEEVKPRQSNEGILKLSPHGKNTYPAGVIVARADGNGPDKNVSIAVCEYKVYPMGTVLRTDGAVYITPYVSENGGRANAALSVVCDRLIPVHASKAGE